MTNVAVKLKKFLYPIMSYIQKLKLSNYLKALLILVILVASPAFTPEYYSWADKTGVTKCTQRSPEGYNKEYLTENQRFSRRKTEI